MSAERYEITTDGATGFYVTKPGLGYSQHTTGISADVIRQLQADFAEVSAERDRLAERMSRPAHAHLDGEHMNGTVDGCLLCQAITERDQLRAQIGEYENAPVVAWAWDYMGLHVSPQHPDFMTTSERGKFGLRQLIARKVKAIQERTA